MTAGYGYDVFGGIRTQSGTSANPWLFTGEQRDNDSGMYYLRARYYDPSIGRFLGRDPVRGGNLYAYVGNNPANFVDPSGLCHKRLGYDQMCGHFARHPKEGSSFGKGSATASLLICDASGCRYVDPTQPYEMTLPVCKQATPTGCSGYTLSAHVVVPRYYIRELTPCDRAAGRLMVEGTIDILSFPVGGWAAKLIGHTVVNVGHGGLLVLTGHSAYEFVRECF